jgi:hypothetical protein
MLKGNLAQPSVAKSNFTQTSEYILTVTGGPQGQVTKGD